MSKRALFVVACRMHESSCCNSAVLLQVWCVSATRVGLWAVTVASISVWWMHSCSY